VLTDFHSTVEELQKQLALQDVRLVSYIDRTNLVQATVSKVAQTLLEGIGLVCIVLILFLGSPFSALVVAVTIPLAMVSAFILMHLTHMSVSMLSLGAIDFGVIVDGAIVVTDNILRRREAKPTEELTAEDVVTATTQVARPIFFATLIIVTAYFPLFSLQQGEAKLFTPMAYTVGYAIFGALLCTLALIPGLAYSALRKPRRMLRNRPLEALGRAYEHWLGKMLDRPSLAYVAAALVFLAIAIVGPRVGREYLPELDEGALWLQVQMPTGLSLETATDMASQLRRAVREFPEVSYVVTQLGRSDEGVDPWTPSHIEAAVGLVAYDKWPVGETKQTLIKRMNERLSQLPGFSVGISQPIADMVNDLTGGTHSPLMIRVIGDDFNELRRIGGQVVDELRQVRGTSNAWIFQEPPIPQIVIEVNRAAAARYGINVSDITNLIQTGIGGAPVKRVSWEIAPTT
jgi:heavy metal efflux system protein